MTSAAQPGGTLRGFLQRDGVWLAGCMLLVAALTAAAATTSPLLGIGVAGAGALAVAALIIVLARQSAEDSSGSVLDRLATPMLLLAAFLAPMNSVRVGGSVTVCDAVLALAFVLLVPVLMRRKLSLPTSYVFGWALLMPVGLIATVFATDQGVSLNHFLRFVAAALVLPVVFVWWRPDRRTITQLAIGYIFGACVSVAYAFVHGPEPGDNRYHGLTTHPNFLGSTTVFAACLLPFVLSQTSTNRRWLYLVPAGLCLAGVWLSGSRGALVVLLAVAVLYPLVERSALTPLLLLFALAVGLLFWNQISKAATNTNALGRLLGNSSASSSDQQRLNVMKAGWHAFLQRPIIGNGWEHALDAHNVYLQVAQSAGLIGLLGFLMILWSLVSPLLFGPRVDYSYRLCYPGLAYVFICALDKSLWDRFMWLGLVLALLSWVLVETEPRKAHSWPPDVRRPVPVTAGAGPRGNGSA